MLQIIWTYHSTRRHRQAIERERVQLAAVQEELAETRSCLENRTAILEATFGRMETGALVVDGELRITEWNPRFAELFDIDPETLQPGLPLDDMLRAQALAGAVGVVEAIEAEVAHRVAQLRSSGSGEIMYAGAGGHALACSVRSLPDGGLIVLVREAAGQEAAAARAPRAGSLQPL